MSIRVCTIVEQVLDMKLRKGEGITEKIHNSA